MNTGYSMVLTDVSFETEYREPIASLGLYLSRLGLEETVGLVCIKNNRPCVAEHGTLLSFIREDSHGNTSYSVYV